MLRDVFNIQKPLENNEVLLLRKGILYREQFHIRGTRFFLIRLFTNHRYDPNKILSRLFAQAARVDQAAAKVYLDTAQELIERAKKHIPPLSKHRVIRLINRAVLWLKGTPLVHIGFFEQKLKAARGVDQDIKPAAPVAPAGPAGPAEVAPAAAPAVAADMPSKAETLAVMREALKECPRNFNHYYHLQKWIKVCEHRETIIKQYQAAVKRVGRGHWYNEPYSGYVLHGELQDPLPVLRSGSEFYAAAYNSVRNDPKGKADFFAHVFSGGNACYEGNYTSLKDWYQPRMNKNLDLVLAFEPTKDKYANLGEMHRVFNAYKFRDYFNLYHDEDGAYDDLNEAHKKICEKYAKHPDVFMEDFKTSVDNKANLLAFIREKKWLPKKCKDVELTEANIEEHLNEYYDIVFPDEEE